MKTIGPNVPSFYTDKRIDDDRDYGFNLFKMNNEVCQKWLDTHPKASVVFVAFGSYAALSVEQMEELAWGLAQSNSFFLWVVSFTLTFRGFIYKIFKFFLVHNMWVKI